MAATEAILAPVCLCLSFCLQPSTLNLALAAGNSDIGTTAAPLLKLPPDPRAAAMGEAFVAAADEASAVHCNPAGLAALDHMSLQLTQAFYLDSVSYQFAGYAQPLSALFHQFSAGPAGLPAAGRPPDWGVLGVGLFFLQAGSVEKTDNTGARVGSFRPADLAASLSYGRALGRVDLGLTGKFVESKIDRVATTLAADLGLRYRTAFNERPAALAAAVRNAGGSLKFNRESDPLPLTVVLGAMLRPTRDSLVAADMSAPSDQKPCFALGGELTQPLRRDLRGALRAGWRSAYADSGLGGLSGLSAGAGLALPLLRVDYAWVPFGILGDTHRLGLTFRF